MLVYLKRLPFFSENYLKTIYQFAQLNCLANLFGHDIKEEIFHLHCRNRVNQKWEDYYFNYLTYIKDQAPMLTADELGCLSHAWNIQLTIDFSNGHQYLSHRSESPIIVRLTNRSHIHWQIITDIYPNSTLQESQSISGNLLAFSPSKLIFSHQAPIYKTEESEKSDSKVLRKNHILIEGRAGIGKTTLMRYFANQWALKVSDRKISWLSKFDTVMLLSLGLLHKYDKKITLERFIYQECFSPEFQNKISSEMILKYLINNQNVKILYLLDGLDEISGLISNKGSCHLELLNSLFQKEYWIMTSRPCHQVNIAELKKNGEFIHLENVGFLDDDIEKYIKVFFTNKELSHTSEQQQTKISSLIASLETNSNVKTIAHIPINLELLCSIWDKDKKLGFQKTTLHITMTTIYEKIFVYLLKRYLLRLDKLNNFDIEREILDSDDTEIITHEKCQFASNFLSELAWIAMENQSLIIKSDMLRIVFKKHFPAGAKNRSSIENLFQHLFILKPTGAAQSSELEQDYYFVHLTFQEFFAAKYLIAHPTKIKNTLKKNVSNQNYEVMFIFTAGLCSSNIDILNSYFEFFLSNRFYSIDSYSQLERPYILLVNSLYECKFNSNINNIEKLKEMCMQYFFYILVLSNEDSISIVSINNRSALITLLLEKKILNEMPFIQRLKDKITSQNLTPNIKERIEKIPAIFDSAVDDVLKKLRNCLDDHEKINLIDKLLYICNNNDLRRIISDITNSFKSIQYYGNSLIKEIDYTMTSFLKGVSSDKTLFENYFNEFLSIKYLLSVTAGNIDDRFMSRFRFNKRNELKAALINNMSDSESSVRNGAVQNILKLSIIDHEIIDAVIKCISDIDSNVRTSANLVLQKFEIYRSSNLITIHIQNLSHIDSSARRKAASFLSSFGEADQDRVIQAYTLNLSNYDQSVRQEAVEALIKLNKADARVLQILNKNLNDIDPQKRQCAAESLIMLEKVDDQVIQVLINTLSDANPEVRKMGAEILGKLKAANNQVIQALVKCLSDENSDVILAGAEALAKLNKANDPLAIKAHIDNLSHKSPTVRQEAIEALIKQNRAGDEIIKALIKNLYEDGIVSRKASEVLEKLNKATDPLVIQAHIHNLSNPNPYRRQDAAEALIKLGIVDDQVIQTLINNLSELQVAGRVKTVLLELNKEDIAKNSQVQLPKVSPFNLSYSRDSATKQKKFVESDNIAIQIQYLRDFDPSLRKYAAEDLGKLSMPNGEVIQGLTNCLYDVNSGVRKNAIDALGRLNNTDTRVIQGLTRCLSDRDPDVRKKADMALINLNKSEEPEVIKAHTDNLSDETPSVRQNAAEILIRLNKINDQVVQALINNLTEYGIKQSAAKALAQINKADDKVIQVLVESLNDSYHRQESAEILARLNKSDDPRVLQALTKKLNYEEPSVAVALRILNKARDPKVIQIHIQMLSHTDASIRKGAANALNELDIDILDNNAIKALTEALQDKDLYVKKIAAAILGKSNKSDEKMIQSLIKNLEYRDSKVRLSAAKSLIKFDRVDEKVVEVLIEILDYNESRLEAVDTLKEINKADDPRVIQALIECLNSPVSSTREGADIALRIINKANDPTVIEAYIQLLRHNEPSVRRSVCQTLGELNTNFALAWFSIEEKKDLERLIGSKLHQILTKPINCYPYYSYRMFPFTHEEIEIIKSQLDDQNKEKAKILSAKLQSSKKTDAPKVKQALIKSLSDIDSDVRKKAAEALEKIDKTHDQEVIHAYIQNLSHTNSFIRICSAEYLEKLNLTHDLRVLEAHTQNLSHPDEFVRNSAARALKKLQNAKNNTPASAEIIPLDISNQPQPILNPQPYDTPIINTSNSNSAPIIGINSHGFFSSTESAPLIRQEEYTQAQLEQIKAFAESLKKSAK